MNIYMLHVCSGDQDRKQKTQRLLIKNVTMWCSIIMLTVSFSWWVFVLPLKFNDISKHQNIFKLWTNYSPFKFIHSNNSLTSLLSAVDRKCYQKLLMSDIISKLKKMPIPRSQMKGTFKNIRIWFFCSFPPMQVHFPTQITKKLYLSVKKGNFHINQFNTLVYGAIQMHISCRTCKPKLESSEILKITFFVNYIMILVIKSCCYNHSLFL